MQVKNKAELPRLHGCQMRKEIGPISPKSISLNNKKKKKVNKDKFNI